MSGISLFSLILVLGIVQGVFLIFSVNRIEDRNREANKILSIFILLITISMIGRLIIEMNLEIPIPNVLALPDAIIFLFGPIIYLYLLKLYVGKKYPFNKYIRLFFPAILFLISEIPLLFGVDHPVRQFWTSYTTSRFVLIEGSALVVNVYYLMKFRDLLSSYEDESDNYFSFPQYPRYLRVISNIMMATLFFWGISYFSWITGYYNILSQIGYRTVWIILPFLIYTFGYYAINQPEIFKLTTKGNDKRREVISEEELLKWKKSLDDYIREEAPYLNAKLTLHELSENIGLKPYQISKLINTVYEKNFNDFINSYRIEEFKRRATKDELVNKTLLSIALESGFNSKTTFNTAFKKLTNQTPLQFIKSK